MMSSLCCRWVFLSAVAMAVAVSSTTASSASPSISARIRTVGDGCGTGYPLPRSRWTSSPPYLRPESCRLDVLPSSTLQTCLRGRKVFILGNSIARNYQAELAEMLGNPSDFEPIRFVASRHLSQALAPTNDSRLDTSAATRALRPKVRGQSAGFSMRWQDASTLRARLKERRQRQKSKCLFACTTTAGGVQLLYYRIQRAVRDATAYPSSAMQYYGAPLVGFPRLGPHAGDICGTGGMTRGCLRAMLRNATADDIVIFQMGLYYYVTPLITKGVARQWPVVALHERVLADAASFPALLDATFPGTVYWGSTGPTSPGKWTKANRPIRHFNEEAAAIFSKAGYEIIDAQGINAPHVRDRFLYNDYVHVAGPLTQAFLHILLNDLCGSAHGAAKRGRPARIPAVSNRKAAPRVAGAEASAGGDDKASTRRRSSSGTKPAAATATTAAALRRNGPK